MLDLLKLIPEATSAIAVIIVVILFLKQQQGTSAEFTAALEQQRQAVILNMDKHLLAISQMLGVVRELEVTVKHTNTVVLELQRMVQDRREGHS